MTTSVPPLPCPYCGAVYEPGYAQNKTDVISWTHPKPKNPNTPYAKRCPASVSTVGASVAQALNMRAVQTEKPAIHFEVKDGFPTFNSVGRGHEVDADTLNTYFAYIKDS